MTKYIILVLLLTNSMFAMASQSYECWRYVDGEPQGYIEVTASSKNEAVRKSTSKFKKIGKKLDYVKCK